MKASTLAFLSFAFVCIFSCGNNSPETLVFKLSNDGADMPSKYIVITWKKDGTAEKFVCPFESASFKCDLKMIEIKGGQNIISMFLKIRNFQFETVAVEKNAEISLKKLAAFEKTDDFTSGMDVGDTSLFNDLAVSVNTELGKTGVLKFYIKNADTDTPSVYFQNSKKHPIHYDFAANFAGEDLTPSEFTKEVYTNTERTRFAGSIIYYSGIKNSPYALTFFPGDTINPSQVALVHKLIEERMETTEIIGDSERLVYLPAGETQEIEADNEQSLFSRRDIPVITREMLYSSSSFQLLNEGRACGTLKKMTPEELVATPVSFKDVLILTRLPNELPVVGGTITEEFQTPLAHVNVAARNRGTPNIALPDASENTKIKPFIGKLVEFIVKSGNYTIKEMTLAQAEKCWDELKKEPFVPESDLAFSGLPLFSEIKFEDSIRVGVKATNLAILSQILPDNTPIGFAVPFYYYNEFVNSKNITAEIIQKAGTDCVDEGRSAEICAEVTSFLTTEVPEKISYFIIRMLADTKFKSDTVFREAVLNTLRYIIYRTPLDKAFATELNSRIAEVFGTEKVRLRSSTNSEDLQKFSGAGLYDSVSAYSEGVDAASLKIGKIWASMWNFSAFEEREFWGIDHNAVFMGICVSSSYDGETSNGVLITKNIADPAIAGMYVNVQPGEASVTNPEDGGIPEIFVITESFGGDVEVLPIRYSSLSPDAAILTHDQVKELYKASLKAHSEFSSRYGINEGAATFDIEFKFNDTENGTKLILKQIRPYSCGE
ncbi:MAG TPA: PEP/pyruvate-binding domain-containing protein [bacterium]|nr:PEP/pyruvate-binding domain-containing protein [bacterium]HPS28749.1 PEP/pyruvate-binding domain-containing protein [bacterium]